MTHADAIQLQGLLPLLRQLRDIKGVREVKPGLFHCRGAAFIHFHGDAIGVSADLKKPAGAGFDRYPVDTPAAQRKLVEDAKRRAGRNDDD